MVEIKSGGVMSNSGEVYQGVYIVYDDSRPFLETTFEEYTVGEGLTLLLILGLFMFAVVKIVYSGFKWLR